MALYAIGTTEDRARPEVLRLGRLHSTESVQTLTTRIGTSEALVQWSSTVTTALQEKESLIASIEQAVAAFEALGVPLVYFYRVDAEEEWEKVERPVFRNLLKSDLKIWHEIRNHPS